METQIHIGARKHVKPSEILSLKADINYTTVIYTDGRKSDVVATTLKKIESRLHPFPHFYRITKSTIINLDCIAHIKNNQIYLVNGEVIVPSRRRGRIFFDTVWVNE